MMIKKIVAFLLSLVMSSVVPPTDSAQAAGACENNLIPARGSVGIVYVHGGSWRSGSPAEIKEFAGLFRNAEIIGCEYTLLPHGTNYTQINEVCDAVRDAYATHERVFLMGYSAGAQIAILASRKVHVDGVISIAGAVDFSATKGLSLVAPILSSLDPVTDAWNDETPTLLVHGAEDTTVRVSGARRYSGRNRNSLLIVVPNVGHTLNLIRFAIADVLAWMK